MVALTNGAESSEEVVTGSVLVIERLVSEPMSEGVDTEGRLKISGDSVVTVECTYVVNKDEPGGTGKEESTSPISPSESSNNGRDQECHCQEKRQVVLVLPPDNPVL